MIRKAPEKRYIQPIRAPVFTGDAVSHTNFVYYRFSHDRTRCFAAALRGQKLPAVVKRNRVTKNIDIPQTKSSPRLVDAM